MKLAVIVTEYPKSTETFIYRDLIAFHELGCEIALYPLAPLRRDQPLHAFAAPTRAWVRDIGFVQPAVYVFWDLVPYDLSILDFILPNGLDPTSVSATGADPLGAGKACVGYLTMPLASGGIAHINVNWLSPTKIRQMVVGGSRRTLVWDDLNPQQRISIHDRGVDLGTQAADAERREAITVSYRMGAITVPALPEKEALSTMATEFAEAINEGRAPRTDGAAGLRVLSVLEAVSASLTSGRAEQPQLADLDTRELVA